MTWDVDESPELTLDDYSTLVLRGISTTHPRVRETVLIGRLQRRLGAIASGVIIPYQLSLVKRRGLLLGPELEQILCFHALR